MDPPRLVTEEDYKKVRENKDANKALTAFVGFGCSFGGKFFAGYGRHSLNNRDATQPLLSEQSRKALIRDMAILKHATFTCKDYRDVDLPKGCVVYADPPYKGKMAAYGLKETFNSEEFWEWDRQASKEHHIYISELEAPDDFVSIWEKPVTRRIDNVNDHRFIATEKLFILKK